MDWSGADHYKPVWRTGGRRDQSPEPGACDPSAQRGVLRPAGKARAWCLGTPKAPRLGKQALVALAGTHKC